MANFSSAVLVFSLHTLLFGLYPAQAVTAQPGIQPGDIQSQSVAWTSHEVEHVYGLPDAKSKDEGTLTLSAAGFNFTGKTSNSMIPRRSVIAVNAGNQRVEIWGMKGRILRMVIPDGGGMAAATVMHHRVDMLTVEFTDTRGGYHGAVFFLPANEATSALESFSKMPVIPHGPQSKVCQGGFVRPHSLLLSEPTWNQAEVPAAYRALVYEHLIDRLRQVKGVDRVFRDGENSSHQGCPQYTMQLSVSGFKKGNQVKRAALGPAGFFVGTTQMKFDATVTDASGRVSMREQMTATVRGETESTNVATDVAKKLARKYSEALKKTADNSVANDVGLPRQQ